MKIDRSKLAKDLSPRSSKKHRNHSFTLLIFACLLTIVSSFFLWREFQLLAAHKLVQDCSFKNKCSQIISALETLVKAHKSLKSSRLDNTHLEQARLERAQLESSHLNNAHLEQAHLEQAHLESSHLNNAHLEQAHLERSNLSHADLHSSYLQGTHLEDTHLYHVNLSHANLAGANLVHAYFFRADLSDANLEQAQLSHAYFHRANLKEANIFRANLIDAKHLSPSQIKSACYWSQAIYKGEWDRAQRKWIVDRQANQQYIDQLQQDKASDPKEPVDCRQWE
ncbi:MAG: pentapeptide repeat-containing protein [Xenococcaceae cyanobacterium]